MIHAKSHQKSLTPSLLTVYLIIYSFHTMYFTFLPYFSHSSLLLTPSPLIHLSLSNLSPLHTHVHSLLLSVLHDVSSSFASSLRHFPSVFCPSPSYNNGLLIFSPSSSSLPYRCSVTDLLSMHLIHKQTQMRTSIIIYIRILSHMPSPFTKPPPFKVYFRVVSILS